MTSREVWEMNTHTPTHACMQAPWRLALIWITSPLHSRPVAGFVNLCPGALSSRNLKATVKHELLHALVSVCVGVRCGWEVCVLV